MSVDKSAGAGGGRGQGGWLRFGACLAVAVVGVGRPQGAASSGGLFCGRFGERKLPFLDV